MSNCIEIEVMPLKPPSVSKSVDTELVSHEEQEQEPLLHSKKLEAVSKSVDIEAKSSEELDQEPWLHVTKPDTDWDTVQLKSKHTMFLSHSGAQKGFVEQLCEDLERAKQVPFFDKRPDSLPKGEKFAQLIFQAARQCPLAIVVVSEEYFTRSKWPMLELGAFVQTGKCTILPLFLGITCKEFGDVKRREGWFRRWSEWAQEDPRIQVDVWKEALRDLDGRNGLEFSEALGEVAYRKEVVATACTILAKNVQLRDQMLPQMVSAFLKITGCVALKFCLFIFGAFVFFLIGFPLMFKFINYESSKMEEATWPPLPKPECTLGGRTVKCSDYPGIFHQP
ncbi:hypothetical protein KC19_11G090200 [Ceratodon purpureus]|uniref:ADP-ribosyl cyclase/cyclic ADP-ribose hydrolase n=1 Tax=Ceratodon purpureus TaxID=3225 RepID=A0A8T0GCK5_CERPU|nr:hypothetical protein KC19_11G090200 [Ceratodon purpureus]